MVRSGSGSHRLVISLFAALALLLAACGDDDTASQPGTEAPDDGDRPLIVATTTILGDIVENLVGDDAEIEVLMPVGADPHDFEASAQQAARLRDADLVVANGLTLEIGLQSVLDSAADDGATVLEVGELVDTIPFGAHSHSHDDDDHGHDDHGHSHDDDHAHDDDDHGHSHDDDHAHDDDDHGHSHDDDHAHDDDDHGHDH
ncbi:MAG: metal ABC transporter substrate-binding protein, partial [Acidimicrobiales bacterium]